MLVPCGGEGSGKEEQENIFYIKLVTTRDWITQKIGKSVGSWPAECSE
jgi:hypothetical protein